MTNRKRIFVDEDSKLHVQAYALDRVVYVSKRFSKSNYRRLCLEVFKTVPGLSKDELLPSQVERFARAVAQDPGFVVEKMGTIDEYYNTMNASANSLLAEEHLLQYLQCTQEQLEDPDDVFCGRARADPRCVRTMKWVGESKQFDDLLVKSALGRRFFRTESGRLGMTAVEQPFGDLGGSEEGGMRVGDVVVALVGGFEPYVLRRVLAPGQEMVENKQDNSPLLHHGAEYQLIGSCHLQGVMNGECFQEDSRPDPQVWRKDLELADILIV